MEEPVRKSVLDQIRETGRSNLCRLIFCAKITSCAHTVRLFDIAIKEKSSQHITGLLLVYSNFVIHILEASEYEIFRFCNDIFSANSEIITNVKCLYVQNGTKRFFKKWHSKKMNDRALRDEEFETIEDNFENASNICKTMVLDLHKLYIELWNTWRLKNYVSTYNMC